MRNNGQESSKNKQQIIDPKSLEKPHGMNKNKKD